jgi:hypothetical protein
MFTVELTREEMAMTDARPQLALAPEVSRTVATLAAGLLIFTGLVFQLSEFICGQLSATSYWLIHIIAVNIWNMLVLRLNVAGFAEMLRYWPLLLIAVGLAILLAIRPARSNSR